MFSIDKCKYIIYEHDHKYAANNNPAVFENFFSLGIEPPSNPLNWELISDDEIEFVNLIPPFKKQLKEYENNPRKISKEEFDKLEDVF